MLSAFTARPIVELEARDKARVESLLAYGDNLLVGLSTGALRAYRTSQNEEEEAELEQDLPRFAKYKVEQLAVVKEAGILLSLSNALVSVHELASLSPLEPLTASRGASLFAVTSNIVRDADTGVPSIVSRLVVAVKRKLVMWSWNDAEMEPANPEFTLASTVKSLTWISGVKLVVGLASNYVLVDVESGSVSDIAGPGSIGGLGQEPAGRLSYIGMGGAAPKPLATRLGEGEVLLAKDVNTHFINADGESLEKRQIPWTVAPDAIGYSYPFILALQTAKGVLEVRNPETLSCLQSVSLPGAIFMQVPNPNVSLAHAGKGFVVASDKKVWRMQALGYDEQIQSLIAEAKYDEAISLLNALEDALLTDKKGNLRECKMLKAQELFGVGKYRNSLDLFTEASAPPQRVLALFPDSVTGIETDTASILSDSSDKKEKQAISELLGFLVDARTRLQKYINFDGTLKDDTTDSDTEFFLSTMDSSLSRQEKLLQTAKTVDTCLFRAYMIARPSLAGALFRLPNFCDPDVVKDKLLQSKRYVDLIDFLHGKGIHREALELLHEFGQKDSDDIPEALRGTERTVAYLQSLSPDHINLIIEFAEWPIQKDPERGMEIFTADTENAESLPRDKVAGFLSRRGRILEIEYLEHIIDALDDKTPAFHQRLIDSYLDGIKSHGTRKEEKAILKQKLLDFLRSSNSYEPWKVLDTLSKDDPDFYEARAIILGKVGQHRQALSIYVYDIDDPEKAEEYCNQVYQAALGDTEEHNVFYSTKTAEEESSNIYSILLSVYLSSKNEPKWDAALDFLSRHGSRIPASSVLGVIPESWRLQQLEDYFTAQVRTANSAAAQAAMVAGLRKAADVRSEMRLRIGDGKESARNRSVLVTDERVCGVCHKRFGGSAIKVMPK